MCIRDRDSHSGTDSAAGCILQTVLANRLHPRLTVFQVSCRSVRLSTFLQFSSHMLPVLPDIKVFENSSVQLRCRQTVKIAHKTDGIKELKRARAKNACFRCTSRSGLEPGYLKRVVVLFGSHFIYLTAYPTFLFPNSILWHSQIPLVYLLLQIPVFLTFPITLVADSRRWIVGHFPSIFQAPRCGTCPPILHSL